MKARRGQQYGMPVSNPNEQFSTGNYSQYNSGSSGSGIRVDSALLDRAHKWAHAADERIAEWGAPVKPYLPVIGRVLVVATFIEDTWRLLTNWTVQANYLWKVRGLPWVIAELFLLINVGAMLFGTFSVIKKQRLEYGVGSLVGVLFAQALAYGLITDMHFFVRNVSLIGGLLLVVSDVFAREKRRIQLPGLPQLDVKDRAQDFILAGRVLIILLFASHLFSTSWSLANLPLNLLSIILSILVVFGYKARFSAFALAVLLLIQNVTTNSYWRLQTWNPQRDSLRYEHFQVLSIIGGLILLVNIGAGKRSFDEKKKIY